MTFIYILLLAIFLTYTNEKTEERWYKALSFYLMFVCITAMFAIVMRLLYVEYIAY